MSNFVSKAAFVLTTLAGFWVLGVLSYRYEIFPFPQLDSLVKFSMATISQVEEEEVAWWYRKPSKPIAHEVATYLPGRLAPGLLLVAGIGEDDRPFARVIDRQGRVLHKWDVSFIRLWPHPTHLPEKDIPKKDRGGFPHGLLFMPNGDLIFNFENLGLIRIDACSRPVWRLPYRTHHSLSLDEDGNIWVPGVIVRTAPVPGIPNYTPEFEDYRILKVSPAGKILRDISVFDLLKKNGRMGLMYLTSRNNWGTTVTEDTLHLNKVEVFPAGFKEGVFKHGDIMISLRNMNAIIVFDRKTEKIRYLDIGRFIRQHDPDFLDGNRISVFDNNNLSTATSWRPVDETGLYSKISILDAATQKLQVYYRGTREHPFFSSVMGKTEWLANGNVLVTEAREGHAFELTPDRKIAWEYFNVVKSDKGPLLGLLSEAKQLPPQYDKKFFAGLGAACSK